MKRYIFVLIFLAITADAQQRTFNAPDLGKTHFIVGLPSEWLRNHYQKLFAPLI